MGAVVVREGISSAQIEPGLVMVSHPMGPRRVNFYALGSADSMVLFDTGLPGFAGDWLRSSGLPAPAGIFISHADADHFGGAGSLKRTAPGIVVRAHKNDSRWIEFPASIVQERYGCASRFGVEYSDAQRAELLAACGGGVKVDVEVSEGDRLVVGEEVWTVLHVPGHSPGHVALWCEQKHILLLGDAVLGSGVPGCDGKLSMPPTHQFIADYLSTLDLLDQLNIGIALTGHWNPLDEKEFKTLIANSRECVHRDLSFVKGCVAKGPATFTELLEALTQSFRAWPEEASIHYFYALSGYLDYLAAKGELAVENSVVRSL